MGHVPGKRPHLRDNRESGPSLIEGWPGRIRLPDLSWNAEVNPRQLLPYVTPKDNAGRRELPAMAGIALSRNYLLKTA